MTLVNTEYKSRQQIDDAFDDWRMSHPAGADGTSDTVITAVIRATRDHSMASTHDAIQAVYDGGPTVDPQLMVIAGNGAMFFGENGIHQIGSDQKHVEMRARLMKDAGMPGTWPLADDAPPRASDTTNYDIVGMPMITAQAAFQALISQGLDPVKVMQDLVDSQDATTLENSAQPATAPAPAPSGDAGLEAPATPSEG